MSNKINRYSDVLTPIHFRMESNKNLLFLIQPEWQFLDELDEDENTNEFKIFKEFIEYYFNKIET